MPMPPQPLVLISPALLMVLPDWALMPLAGLPLVLLPSVLILPLLVMVLSDWALMPSANPLLVLMLAPASLVMKLRSLA